jgi:hypothetical protein
MEILYLPWSRCYCPANIAQLNSCQLSTQLQRRLFSSLLAELDSTLNLQPNSLAHQPTLNFTSITWTALSRPGVLGEDTSENIASNRLSIVVMGGCLAIARISLTCLPAVTKQRIPPRDRCIATVLHATISCTFTYKPLFPFNILWFPLHILAPIWWEATEAVYRTSLTTDSFCPVTSLSSIVLQHMFQKFYGICPKFMLLRMRATILCICNLFLKQIKH